MIERDYLLKQKGQILSEMDFHEILEFCDSLGPKPFIVYDTIAQIREELAGYLDDFINEYTDHYYRIGYNNKWVIDVYSNEGVWTLRAAFEYHVTEAEGL